jgi:hypothetical protein
MPTPETLERFIARVESNAHAEAIAEFYAADGRIVEFHWLDGSTTRMEELAYQRWEGERIVEEQFFYDPAQPVPRK